MKAPWVIAVVLTTSLALVTVRAVHADQRERVSHAHAVRVDDDGDRGGWGHGDRGGDGDRGGRGDDWFPLWFGFHYFVPRPPVVVQPDYYPPPPPPPPRPAYYYFCRNPEGYYPQVPYCPSGWMRVLPSGGPP